VTDRLYKFAWAARNYYIYLRLTNAGNFLVNVLSLLGTAILLALCFLGTALFFMNAVDSILSKKFVFPLSDYYCFRTWILINLVSQLKLLKMIIYMFT